MFFSTPPLKTVNSHKVWLITPSCFNLSPYHGPASLFVLLKLLICFFFYLAICAINLFFSGLRMKRIELFWGNFWIKDVFSLVVEQWRGGIWIGYLDKKALDAWKIMLLTSSTHATPLVPAGECIQFSIKNFKSYQKKKSLTNFTFQPNSTARKFSFPLIPLIYAIKLSTSCPLVWLWHTSANCHSNQEQMR